MVDKFGIFKLLNSLVSNFNSTKTQQTNNSNSESGQNLLENISSFFSSMNKEKENANPPKAPAPATTNTSSFEGISSPKPDSFKGINKNTNNSQPPINAKMISTMRSHDELIKRVYEKNNKATLKK